MSEKSPAFLIAPQNTEDESPAGRKRVSLKQAAANAENERAEIKKANEEHKS